MYHRSRPLNDEPNTENHTNKYERRISILASVWFSANQTVGCLLDTSRHAQEIDPLAVERGVAAQLKTSLRPPDSPCENSYGANFAGNSFGPHEKVACLEGFRLGTSH